MNFLGYVHGLPNIFTKAIGPGYISESKAHTFGGGGRRHQRNFHSYGK